MRRLSFAVVLLLAAPLVSAQVYKWRDAQGTTHYSQAAPPDGIKYSQVNVATDSPASSSSNGTPAASNPAASSSSSGDGSESQTMADTPENRGKLCTQLRTSISALMGTGPVVMQQQGGQQQLLNADQRKQQLDASQSQYQQYCS